jgi:recombination protein RecR
MRNEIVFCKYCHNIADTDVCTICVNSSRNRLQICVVENIRDVIAIESTQQYNGLYHLLGGILSPLDGIGPEHLNIDSLYQRVKNDEVKELIMALSPTIEVDTTVYYIARGIAFGGELEYADEMTLARSIAKRLPIENYVSINGKK